MGLFADIVSLFEAGYGWLFVSLLIAYELWAPTLLDRDTALAPLVRDMPAKLDEVDERQSELQSEVSNVQSYVEEVQDRQQVQMQVQRAQARATEDMDEDEVDAYLLKNGVQPDAFLRGTDDTVSDCVHNDEEDRGQ